MSRRRTGRWALELQKLVRWSERALRWRALRWRALGSALAVLLVLPWALLVLRAVIEPLPAALVSGQGPTSLRIEDRHGKLLRELRTREGRLSTPVELRAVSPYVVPALLAAEDRRFYAHFGVDPLAVARATLQTLLAGRVVSGASTLTQQLARNLVPRPRSAAGKFREMALALRIEASLGKERILQEYLNRIEFGPNLVGIEAASRHYFDKSAKALDLAEAATLAALLRGPSLYDPRRGLDRLRARRAWVLRRLRATSGAPEDLIARAEATQLKLHRGVSEGGSLHLAFALASGRLLPNAQLPHASAIRSTLDSSLQREVETIARRASAELIDVAASGVAVLVVDNDSSEVLAYVGSPDYFAAGALGGNDGTRALRQPGSALKPFVYAAAFERLGWDAATLLPDLGLELATPRGRYVPQNYDGREHGPVRLRVALASSLNLPALYAAQQVGPAAVLDVLRRFGFDSLSRSAGHYGAAIALGDGEVRLSELCAAYAALAREGEWRPLKYAQEVTSAGRTHALPSTAGRRVLSRASARAITHVLADDGARMAGFGPRSLLAFPFPAAAKTGTSKGYRDNWAVAYTPSVTVAVWVGNFDGRPMLGSSGISGAGPVLHATLLAAMRGRSARSFSTSGLLAREVCPLSGQLPARACPHRLLEYFAPGHAPTAACTLHELVAIDPINGLRAGPSCRDAREQSFEYYPERYANWARASGRPLRPEQASPRCPLALTDLEPQLAIEWPANGARFVSDDAAERQEIVVRARSSSAERKLTLLVDGREVAHSRAPYQFVWQLSAGPHELQVVSAAQRASPPVRVEVEPPSRREPWRE